MTTNRADLDNSTSENGAEPVTLAFVAKNSNPPQGRAIPRRRASALSRPVGVGERFLPGPKWSGTWPSCST
jgi:hypothetical protein